jgi:hypothetical protein
MITPPINIKEFRLTVDGMQIKWVTLFNIAPAPTMLDLLDSPSSMLVEQPLSIQLQLNSSATDYASLAGNNTAWRVNVTKPDSTTLSWSEFVDWQVVSGIYKWQTLIGSDLFTEVGGGSWAVRAPAVCTCKNRCWQCENPCWQRLQSVYGAQWSFRRESAATGLYDLFAQAVLCAITQPRSPRHMGYWC